jgi:Ribonuclease HI
VCRSHQLIVCPRCCLDFSFTQDTDSDEGLEDEDLGDDGFRELVIPSHVAFASGGTIRPLRIGTGRVIPIKSHAQKHHVTPQSLYPPRGPFSNAPGRGQRFVHLDDPKQFLIYTDGSCLNNGQANPRAGCSFVYKLVDAARMILGDTGHVRFRLENQGPTGECHPQTSNRAELRAVIAALRFRCWHGEGFKHLVIATDSEYVVKGATSWVRGWRKRGWVTSIGKPVKNRDLWECLLGQIEESDKDGLQVSFWRIPRALNTDADYHARVAANQDPIPKYVDVSGLLC